MTQEFNAEFCANILQRMENVENGLEKVSNFIFTGTPERASLEIVVKKFDDHISAMCDYAAAMRRISYILITGASVITSVYTVLRVIL